MFEGFILTEETPLIGPKRATWGSTSIAPHIMQRVVKGALQLIEIHLNTILWLKFVYVATSLHTPVMYICGQPENRGYHKSSGRFS